MEGSLGKIAFSNSKTPRPLLNLKRPDSEARVRQSMARELAGKFDRKQALRDIEHLYDVLMKLEDHERRMPPAPLTEESGAEAIEGHMRWRAEMEGFRRGVWEGLRVMAPIEARCVVPHSFFR